MFPDDFHSWDWARIIVLIQILIVAYLYAQTTYRGFRESCRKDTTATKRLNRGRAAASLGVVVLLAATGVIIYRFLGEPLTFLTPVVQLALVLFLYGWTYSVRSIFHN